MSRLKWLLLAAVCGVHFVLISSFLNASGRGGRATSVESSLTLRMVTAYPPQPAKSTELGLVSAQTMTPAEVLAPLPNASKVDVKSEAVFSPAGTSSTDPSSFLNRDKFLGAGELDESAKASNAFEDALEKALPRSFDSIVLEFFIDENGQIVQLTCIEGDCSTELSKQLEQLLLIPLTAAIKNGQPVPSRKVIQVSPTPTFGL